jgi:hypothetical protein
MLDYVIDESDCWLPAPANSKLLLLNAQKMIYRLQYL